MVFYVIALAGRLVVLIAYHTNN